MQKHTKKNENGEIVQSDPHDPRKFPDHELWAPKAIIVERQKIKSRSIDGIIRSEVVAVLDTLLKSLLLDGTTLDSVIVETAKKEVEFHQGGQNQSAPSKQSKESFSYFNVTNYSLISPSLAFAQYFSSAYHSFAQEFKSLFAEYVAPKYITLPFKTRSRLRKRKKYKWGVVGYAVKAGKYAVNEAYALATNISVKIYQKFDQYFRKDVLSKNSQEKYVKPLLGILHNVQPSAQIYAPIAPLERPTIQHLFSLKPYNLKDTAYLASIANDIAFAFTSLPELKSVPSFDAKLATYAPNPNATTILQHAPLSLAIGLQQLQKNSDVYVSKPQKATHLEYKIMIPHQETGLTASLESEISLEQTLGQSAPTVPYVHNLQMASFIFGKERAGDAYRDINGNKIGKVLFKHKITEEDIEAAGGKSYFALALYYLAKNRAETEVKESRYFEPTTGKWITDMMIVSKANPTEALLHFLVYDKPLYNKNKDNKNPLWAKASVGEELSVIVHGRNPGHVERWYNANDKRPIDWEHGGLDAYRIPVSMRDIGKRIEDLVILHSAALGLSRHVALDLYQKGSIMVTEQKNVQEFGGIPIYFSERKRTIGNSAKSFEISYHKSALESRIQYLKVA